MAVHGMSEGVPADLLQINLLNAQSLLHRLRRTPPLSFERPKPSSNESMRWMGAKLPGWHVISCDSPIKPGVYGLYVYNLQLSGSGNLKLTKTSLADDNAELISDIFP